MHRFPQLTPQRPTRCRRPRRRVSVGAPARFAVVDRVTGGKGPRIRQMFTGGKVDERNADAFTIRGRPGNWPLSHLPFRTPAAYP